MPEADQSEVRSTLIGAVEPYRNGAGYTMPGAARTPSRWPERRRAPVAGRSLGGRLARRAQGGDRVRVVVHGLHERVGQPAAAASVARHIAATTSA